MNILSITGILPIPDITQKNDFLIPLYTAYRRKFPKDNVYFVLLEKLRPFSKLRKPLKEIRTYELKGFTVTLLRFFSTWRLGNLHTILSPWSAYLFNKRELDRIITNNRIDIIHAEFIIPDGYLAYLLSKKYHIPYLVTTHFEFRYFDSLISRSQVLKVLQNASWVTPLNYPSMELYKNYGIKNITIVPHGIDEPFLATVPVYNNTEEVRILSIGALIGLKNLDKVLYALANLKNRFVFRYTIVGSGPEKANLMALVNQLELEHCVEFTAKIPYHQIPDEMGRNDIFILPSFFESFGRVLFEAMAVGLPTICAKHTGIHGYFKEGEEGLSVDHQNIGDIESKLSMLLSDVKLRREIGRKAKELVSKYTWNNIVDTLHHLYEESRSSNSPL